MTLLLLYNLKDTFLLFVVYIQTQRGLFLHQELNIISYIFSAVPFLYHI
ncbi:hypothetical protein OIU78_001756 [Salix suchowensis]|nr:hypothetical protein OIU78_001756 [Salix suchowensis]